jgi:hypothetical protein
VRGEGQNFKMSFTSSEITRDAQNFIYRWETPNSGLTDKSAKSPKWDTRHKTL